MAVLQHYTAPMVVRASAGTGKTFALSNRFIALLAAGERPDLILATTFTRKAAGEVRERVLLRLAEAATESGEWQQLTSFIKQAGFTQGKAEDLLLALIKSQHRLNICTLDSFFYRLAQSFGLEMGLLPGWTMADAALDQQLYNEAVQSLCSGKNSAELSMLVSLLNKGATKRSIHERIADEVKGLYQLFLQTEPGAWDWLEVAKGFSRQKLLQLKNELEDMPLPETKAGEKSKPWLKAVAADLAAIEREDWPSFIKSGIAAKILRKETKFNRTEIPAETVHIYQGLLKHARAVLLGQLKGQTQAGYRLMSMFDSEYLKLRHQTRSLSFDDVKFKLHRAALTGNLDQIYYRLDTSISHLLLDEFQDTSSAEWQILVPFADEIMAEAGPEHMFFCVGDTKQAIYGWRGGVAEIFDNLEQRWSHLKVKNLEKSYRCAPAIVEAVNQVFETIAENSTFDEYHQAAADWQKRYSRHVAAHADQKGYTSLRIVSHDPKLEPAADAVFRQTALLIKQIRERSPSLDIGVLTRKNSTVRRLIFELSRDPISIPASEEGGNPLTDSPVVAAFLSLLKLIDHPGDQIACFHLAQSPLAEIFDFSACPDQVSLLRLVGRARKDLLNNGFGATIFSWAARIADKCDQRNYRRLMQFVELAYAFEIRSFARVAEFISFVELQKVEDPSSSKVRVMTVHQSKGLEFDVVLLPELDFRLLGQNDSVMTFRDNPLLAPTKVLRSTSEAVRLFDPVLVQMHQQACDEKIKESLSLLYVAMTRAKHELHMLIRDPRPQRTLPLTYGSVLWQALACGDVDEESGIVFQQGDPSWFEKQEAKEKKAIVRPAGDSAAMQKIKLLQSEPDWYLELQRQTPSEMEGGQQVDLALAMRLSGRSARLRGLTLHKFCEAVEWLDSGMPERRQLVQFARAESVMQDPADFERSLDEFFQLLANDEVAGALKREAYADYGGSGLDVYREQPFMFRINQVMLSGVFDRLVVIRDGEKALAAEVLDFKTDSFPADCSQALADRVDYYRPQMQSYRGAAARFTGLPEGAVSLKLVFITAGIVESL